MASSGGGLVAGIDPNTSPPAAPALVHFRYCRFVPQHHPLEGCLNLRDIGGYPAGADRVVRTGCLFRSDELCALTDEDLGALARLGIKVVFDLRNHGERQARPSRLPPDVELLERSTEPTEGAVVTVEEQIATATLPERDDGWIGKVYADYLEHMAPDFRVVVERAAEARTRPLLFHCAAGKDRTGLTAALLLGLLGVSDDVILNDYDLTNDHYTPGRLSALEPLLTRHGVPEERVRFLFEARREVMADTLRMLHDRWGGFDGYASEVLGLTAELPERLRSELLTPAEG